MHVFVCASMCEFRGQNSVKGGVDPQFCPSTLTFYPMSVILTYRSHMASLGPRLTLVSFELEVGLYVVH